MSDEKNDNPLGCRQTWGLVSAEMLKALLDNRFLSVPSAVFLYLRLNDDEHLNYREVAGCLGFHEASVYRAVKELADAGLIERNRRGDLSARIVE